MTDEWQSISPYEPSFAEFFDELPLWSAPFARMLLDCVPLRPRGTLLDVGAGTGFLTLELAERCGPATKIIAVDPWPQAMERLRRKVAYKHLSNVTILERDARATGLPEASVDLVVSNLGINNFEDPQAVSAECFRVAKTGADLILTTNVVGHMSEFYDVYQDVLVELGHAERLPELEAHIAHRGTTSSVSDALAKAGFEVVKVARDSFRMRFANGSTLLRHTFIRAGFLEGWKAVARQDAVAETFAALESKLNAASEERGELALTIPMACLIAKK